MKFRLITTVWGERFADLFLRLAVRSLMSEGNADAFAGRHDAAYSIFTTEETADYLRRSPLFQQLQKSIDVQFAIFRPGDIDPKLTSSHWVGWRKGVKIARENEEIAIFVIADMLYPRNTLHRWVGLFEKGFRAIWTSTTQVVKESAMREIEGRFPSSSTAPISMSSQEVIDLAVRHLHPKVICMFRDSGRASRHPEVVFAEVPGEGLAQRVIGSHAMCVDPNFFDLSDALSPLNRFEAIAFEAPTGVGLEPMLKDVDLYARRTPMTEDRLSNMGTWLNYFFTPPDLIESRRTYRFALHEPTDDAGFRRVRDALGFYACQVRVTGAIYRVVRELQRVNCTLAAQLTATAHYAGRLRRHWRVKGAVTAFVPENSAIEHWGLQHFDALLMPDNEKQLVDAVLAHVCEGQREFRVGDELAVLVGPRVVPAASAMLQPLHRTRIVAGPYQRDDCTIYVIDKVLLPSAAADAPKPSLLPNRWEVHPTRRFSTAAVAAAPAAPAPAPHPPVEVAREPLRTLEPLGRSVARGGYRALRALPGGARPAEWLKSAAMTTIHRARAYRAMMLARRIAAEHPVAAPPAAPHASTRNAPSSELVELFRDLQRARAVLTLADVLHFYQSKVSGIARDLPALAMVEGCVRDAGISVDGLMAALRDLLDKAPDFAEAWYELGDLHLARGEHADAVACFDRCVVSREAATAYGVTSCYALASMSKAMVLEAAGSLEAAADAYRVAIESGGAPGMLRVAYARLLRRLGKPRDAAREFDVGMESEGTVCNVPPMPRNFAELTAPLAPRFARR